MNRALVFLWVRSLRGRTVRMVRRLREPRYLLGFLVGAGWMLFWISSMFWSGHGRWGFGLSPAMLEAVAGPLALLLQLTLCLLLAIGLTIWWLLPFGKHAIELSEPELHLLLPAPIPRRQIIQFAVLRSQPGILVGALILTLFTGARSLHDALPGVGAAWLFLSTWDLHAKGRALWLARLDELPQPAAWRQRLTAWLIIGGIWSLLLLGLTQLATVVLAHPPRIDLNLSTDALREIAASYVGAARDGLLGWVLTPLLWLTGPWFARFQPLGGFSRLLVWVAPCLALVAHNEWVVRSQSAFEEAALERARHKSRRADPAARFWKTAVWRRTWQPFRLSPQAPPELAILWKNLMLGQRIPLWLLGATATAVLVALTSMALLGTLPAWALGIQGGVGLALLVIPPLLSPRSMRNDLRADLLKVEILRPWPLAGWRLFAAEMSAPVMTVMLQSLFGAVLLLSLDLTGSIGSIAASIQGLPPAWIHQLQSSGSVMVLILAGLAPLLFALACLNTCLENLAALMFPSWVQLGIDRKQAAAKFGQNMVLFLALSIATLVVLAPSAALVAVVLALQLWAWKLPLVLWELPLLGLLATMPLAAIVAALVGLGGRLWDRLDPSAEILGGGPA